MLLSDLAFQAFVAFIWAIVQLPFNIFVGVAYTAINGALGQ
jgi:hypothetical protein